MKRKQLVLKELRILSNQEKSAKIVKFDPRRNLIIGENDVGKSSIIKSIYHTLGADVKFGNVWEKADAISLLSFSFNDKSYSVLRVRNQFGIFDSDCNLIDSFDSIIKGIAPYLNNLFNNQLKLKQSKTNRRVTISPAIQFLPFYIDQDKSWSKAWDAFEGLGMYSSFKNDLIDFVTGIKPNEWYLCSEEIDLIASNLNELNKEMEILKSAKKTISEYIPKDTFDIDINYFKIEIRRLVVELDKLKTEEESYKRNIIKRKSKEAFLNNEISVLNKSVREINKDYKHSLDNSDEEITCPTCNASYENSMISRFGLLEDIDTCRVLLSDYLDEKKDLKNEISNLGIKLNLQRVRVREITSLLDEKKEKVTLKDFIQNESSKQVRQVFVKGVINYSKKISKLEELNNVLKEKRSKLRNKERKEKILSKFNTLIDTFFIKLNVKTLNSKGFNGIPSSVKSQGSDTPRALLAYYYAILFVSDEFTNLPLFPLIIDSPNQQDQDETNIEKIINFIFDNTPEDYQLILGTVSLHGVEYKGHTITPLEELKLLNRDDYEDTYKLVSPLLDVLHESLVSKG